MNSSREKKRSLNHTLFSLLQVSMVLNGLRDH